MHLWIIELKQYSKSSCLVKSSFNTVVEANVIRILISSYHVICLSWEYDTHKPVSCIHVHVILPFSRMPIVLDSFQYSLLVSCKESSPYKSVNVSGTNCVASHLTVDGKLCKVTYSWGGQQLYTRGRWLYITLAIAVIPLFFMTFVSKTEYPSYFVQIH